MFSDFGNNCKTFSSNSSATTSASKDQAKQSDTLQSTVKALTKRITTLEIENSNLQNTVNDLNQKVQQGESRTQELEEKMQGFEDDKQSFLNFMSSVSLQLKNIKRKPEKKKKEKNPKQQLYQERESASQLFCRLGSRAFSTFSSKGKESDEKESLPQELEGAPLAKSESSSPVEVNIKEVMRPGLTYYYALNKKEGGEEEKIDHSENQANQNFEDDSFDLLTASQRKLTKKLMIQKIEEESSSPKKAFEPTRLFENFLVLGAKEEDFKNVLKKKSQLAYGETMTVEPTILFDFSEISNSHERVSPAGIERRLASWGIPLTKYHEDSEKANSKFQKAVLKSQRKYHRRFICPLPPHNEKILVSKWTDKVEAVNPQNQLYAFCIQKNDFMLLTGEKSSTEQFLHSDTIYCLLTYYPIPQLAFQILISILNILRAARQRLYYGQFKQSKSKVDFRILDILIPIEVTNYLSSILKQNAPFPKSMIEYNLYDEHFGSTLTKYDFPSGPNAYLELAQWSAEWVFSYFSLDDLIFIVSSILLERKIAFFSRHLKLLTAVINVFLGLIYPFKYLCPMAVILPTNKDDLFETLPPMIIGVHRAEEYFWRKRLMQRNEFAFVFIDSKTIYYDPEGFPKMPIAELATGSLKILCSKVNKGNSKFEEINDKQVLLQRYNENSQKKVNGKVSGNYVSGKETVDLCQDIFLQFRSQIERKIVSYLPYLPRPLSDNEEIDKVVPEKKWRDFFYDFSGTMMYVNYEGAGLASSRPSMGVKRG